METFIDPKEMIEEAGFSEIRAEILKNLHIPDIDPPIRDIIHTFRSFPHCVTIQCCHGHLLESSVDNDRGLYQIAYLALMLENSPKGREYYNRLAKIAQLDTEFIQWGSAEWFWDNQGLWNSYVIQAEPYRFRHLDRFLMNPSEAMQWHEARTMLFQELRKLLHIA